MKTALRRLVTGVPALYAVYGVLQQFRLERENAWLTRLGGGRQGLPSIAAPTGQHRPWRVLYVGTDWEQDSAGLIQGLGSVVSQVEVFEPTPGTPGQLQPKTRGDIDAVRKANGRALLGKVDSMLKTGPLDLIVGQMWNYRMPCSTLLQLRRRSIKVVNIAMDDRHAFRQLRLSDGSWGGTLGLVPGIDLACTAAPEAVGWYRSFGVPAIFWPEASDPKLFCPHAQAKTVDVCFVGAKYGIREELVSALMAEGFNVAAYGQGWASGRIRTKEVPGLFARSRIVLGSGTILHTRGLYALKMRDFDGPMSGSLYLTHNNPDLRLVYEIDREIVVFQDKQDLLAKVKYYLANETEREAIAMSGRQRAERDHTWSKRFDAMFTALANLRGRPEAPLHA